MGGGVIYTHRARKRLVKIDFKDHPGVRSSSEPYASLLAGSVRELLSATWGLAETGAAGPTGNSYGDDAGHTCVAVARPVTDVRTLETASSDREANMWAFTDEALDLFICLRALILSAFGDHKSDIFALVEGWNFRSLTSDSKFQALIGSCTRPMIP